MNNSKIIITGTGRAGTTFLMRLFTLLKLSTGFSPETMNAYIHKNCNAGLERSNLNTSVKIIKNPTFMTQIQTFVNQKHKIELVIVPMRDLNESAQSRVNNGKKAGGLFNATDLKSQVAYYNKALDILKTDCNKNNIPILFIEFNKMISNSEYLFNLLKPVINNISFQAFNDAYIRASEMSKPKNK
ncbi:hypothetical protein QKU48_gp1004 [Fadolivirus algeromassiliense]|jgi:hypothetical protein|uniref:Sulfotransferase domain-containing protein n=1 Tax=Fadolivirus FV1/VV64 TaxID=3070911 RepID=A0A7D3R1F8_9VIRU|nr:hypothetical protein QKU48_gp1004 [Fadolivirus algeromassiliense]QKF94462.1 hypothetical protein Fadolivirus_1_1004 [Fadolivirus FV1/VV64]